MMTAEHKQLSNIPTEELLAELRQLTAAVEHARSPLMRFAQIVTELLDRETRWRYERGREDMREEMNDAHPNADL